MATIALARIDSRLIHGQVITKWVKQVNASHILVIDDSLASDKFMSKIYLLAAPPGIRVHILALADALATWQSNKSQNRLLVLFKDVKTAKQAWQGGLPVIKLQVGGLGGAPGRKVVFQNITLDQRDADDLTAMQAGGVEVFFQTVPEDTPGQLAAVLKGNKF